MRAGLDFSLAAFLFVVEALMVGLGIYCLLASEWNVAGWVLVLLGGDLFVFTRWERNFRMRSFRLYRRRSDD